MEQKICMCRCHEKDGIKTLHFMPCCEVCSYLYINNDGTVDEEALKKAQEDVKRRSIKKDVV